MDLSSDLNILLIIWQSGVVVKLVLLLLIGFSIFSWAVIFRKRKQLREIQEQNEDFYQVYQSSESLKDILLKTERMPDSPFKLMFIEGHNELMRMKEKLPETESNEALRDHFEKFGLTILERGLQRGINQASHKMEHFQSVLASIGSVSPFVGLFGTVWGIIDSFQGLATGGGTLEAVAPGIAEALVATAVGLAAAIPAVWFYNQFNNENQKIMGDMETFGQDFLNIVERSLSSK